MEEKGITMGKEGSLHVFEEGELLHIVVDTSKELGPSASGKTIMIASSGGNKKINVGTDEAEDLVMLGLNIYRYPS